MITKVNAKLGIEVVSNIEKDNISDNHLDGCLVDEVTFTATIKTKEDIAKVKRFLTICRANLKK